MRIRVSRHTVSILAKRWLPLPLLSPLSLPHHHFGSCTASLRSISANPAPSGDLQSALSRTVTVRNVMDVWEAHRDSIYTHNVVRSCLYYSLKAARAQQLSAVQLFEQPRFELFWKHLLDEIPGMSANSAVKCLYNCAQFDFKHRLLTSSLVAVCTQKSKFIPSVSFGILLWSLKRLDMLSSTATRPLLEHVTEHFHAKLCSGVRFKTQSLSNILWVLSSTGNLPSHVGETVARCLPHYMKQFDLHSLSLCLWSLTASGTTLPQSSLDLAGSVAARFLQSQKSVQNVVHCCWAFASAEYYHEPFCRSLSRLIITEPRSSLLLSARLLSSVVWMCAKVSHYDPDLMDHVASLALDRLNHFNAQDLGNLLYAYVQLNHPHERLVTEVTEQFVSDRKLLCDDDACVSVAWANIATGNYPRSLLEHMMEPGRVRRKLCQLQ